MPLLEQLDRSSLAEFLTSPVAVLVLGKSDCGACAQWAEELTAFLATLPDDHIAGGARFGRIYLDQPGLGFFKKSSPWLVSVHDLPYTALYADGAYARGFVGLGTSRLVNRLKRVMP